MDSLQILALALGAAWASGINLYATVLLLGALNAFGIVTLPDEMAVLSSPMVLGAAALLFFVEFFADKIPAVDSLWDSVHTFVRIPAGAMMAMGAVDGLDGAFLGEDIETVAAMLAGGTLAAGSHLTKASTRAVINTSPEPFSNWIASFTEDIVAIGGVLLAIFNPLVFLGLLVLFVLLAVWLIPKLWRALRFLFSKIGIGSAPPPPELPQGLRFGRTNGNGGDGTAALTDDR